MSSNSDYHKKQNTLAALRKKALEKNPDEFYFKMISSQLQVRPSSFKHINSNNTCCILLINAFIYFCVFSVACWQDGVHVAKQSKEEVEVTEEQKKVMRSQDIKYVEMKRVAEAKVGLFTPA